MKPATVVLGSTLAASGAVLAFGAAALVGEPLRRAAILHLDDAPPSRPVPLSDATPAAATFFLERDSVTVVVPWDMSVRELLGLYHLDNNVSARDALETQLGVARGDDRVREGQVFSFVLTVREDVR